jgi:hypothetical protein
VQLQIFSATVQIYTGIGILTPEEGDPLVDRTNIALSALQ